jgi:flagellar hook-associated protein 2
MPTTVSVAGFGSGIDVDALVSGLVNASSGNLNLLQQRASDYRSASSTLSAIGTSLGSLQSAADAISSVQGIASYTATSSSSAVVASANGSALPSSFSVNVTSLAKEQRTYSATFASSSDALGQSGTLGLQIGTGTAVNLTIDASDSLDSIAAKINGAGLRVNASVFYDGSAYRLQVRGLDTGAANAVTFNETGTLLDLNGTGATTSSGKTVQSATDASLTIDGFTVTRPTNQITGIVQGVTLALTSTTSSPATVTVAGDASSLKTKVASFVSSFNSVINAIHNATGFGTTKATNQALAADSALRTINDRLSSFMGSAGTNAGSYKTLADVGIALNRDGTLLLDDTKLTQAVGTDPGSVTKLLARPPGATSGGMMADLNDILKSLTASDTGILALRGQSFDSQAKSFDTRATSEQTRLDNYANNLRKQFTAMNDSIGASQLLGASLTKAFG